MQKCVGAPGVCESFMSALDLEKRKVWFKKDRNEDFFFINEENLKMKPVRLWRLFSNLCSLLVNSCLDVTCCFEGLLNQWTDVLDHSKVWSKLWDSRFPKTDGNKSQVEVNEAIKSCRLTLSRSRRANLARGGRASIPPNKRTEPAARPAPDPFLQFSFKPSRSMPILQDQCLALGCQMWYDITAAGWRERPGFFKGSGHQLMEIQMDTEEDEGDRSGVPPCFVFYDCFDWFLFDAPGWEARSSLSLRLRRPIVLKFSER